MTPEFQQKLATLVESHEGRVSFLYPDSRGNVTLGVGHLLPDVESAASLPFIFTIPPQLPHPPAEIPADIPAIAEGWDFVKKTRKPYALIRLTDQATDTLRDADLARAYEVVLRSFQGAALPEPALLALCDMAFNLGSFHDFPRLVKAVERRDWNTAAQECVRDGVSPKRNGDTVRLFQSAAEIAA